MGLRESYTRMTKQKPTKISFFGNFGTMNFGNEATLLAVVSRLRLLFPNCAFCCICTGPENVVATHGIDAVPYTIRWLRIWDRQAPLGKRLRTAFPGLGEEIREYIRSGVDLDVRTNVAIDLEWEPVPELMAEIHDGDSLVRADWPWHWWGLEPLDRKRNDWQTRYASAFRVGEP
jgi:hypothetical protein